MKCWLAHTCSSASRICAASGRYCGFRSRSGTCIAGGVASFGLVAIACFLLDLVAVVLAEPLDELAHPDLDRGRRTVADVTHQVVDVGEGLRHVAELHRQEILLRLAAEAFLDHLDVAHQLYRLVVADVVEPEGRGA